MGEDTLQRCRRVLGPEHETTLLAAAALTFALVQLGEVEAARALAQDTLQRCRRVFGQDNPLTQQLTQVASSGHLLPGGDAAADRPSRPL